MKYGKMTTTDDSTKAETGETVRLTKPTTDELLREILDVLGKQEPVSLEPVLKAIEGLAIEPIETEDGFVRTNPREALTAEEFDTMCGHCEYRRKHDQKSKT